MIETSLVSTQRSAQPLRTIVLGTTVKPVLLVAPTERLQLTMKSNKFDECWLCYEDCLLFGSPTQLNNNSASPSYRIGPSWQVASHRLGCRAGVNLT